MALDENASLERVAGRGRTDALAGEPPAKTLAYAIWRAARSLGRVPSAVGYDGVREEPLLSVSRRVRHTFPTSAQIVQVTGTWEAALALAGLEVPEPQRAGGGVSAADMVRAFVRANGVWPTKRALEQFGHDAGVRWRRPHQDGIALRDVIADLHREMDSRGENPPALAEWWSADRGRPSVDLDAPEFAAAPTATEGWTRETALDAVAGWLRARDGHEATWRAYIADAAGNPLMPQGSTITRFGGWAVVRGDADKVRKSQRR